MRSFACLVVLLLAGTEVVAQSHDKTAAAPRADAHAKPAVAAKPAAPAKVDPHATAVAAAKPDAHAKPVAKPASAAKAAAHDAADPLARLASKVEVVKPVVAPGKPVVAPALARKAGSPSPSRVTNPDADLIRVAKEIAVGLAAAAKAQAAVAAGAVGASATDVPRRHKAATTRPLPRRIVRWPAIEERWLVGWPVEATGDVKLAWPADETVALQLP